MLPVAPPVFAHWRPTSDLAERLGPVRLVLSGSAPLSAELVEEFTARTGIAVHQGYGLTEAAPVVTSTLRERRRCSPARSGPRCPASRSRLVDERGRAPEGEDPGEIRIRGDNLFSGYWPDGSGGPDDEGWWSTGDVGFLDATGDLFLVDRIKELVIVSGFNVYPVEVEEVVREVRGVDRGGGDRRPTTRDRRGGGGLRRGARRATRTSSSPAYAGTARRGWPGSSSRAGSRSSTSCR